MTPFSSTKSAGFLKGLVRRASFCPSALSCYQSLPGLTSSISMERCPLISCSFTFRIQCLRCIFRMVFGDLTFESPRNPHAGCFVLSPEQLRHWSQQPWWLDGIAPLFRRWRVLQHWACSKLSRSTSPPVRHHHSLRLSIGYQFSWFDG